MALLQIREALNQAIDEEMERDSGVFIMGEEVAQYNGAYKVTQGLWKKYGDKRVIDTPITEAGFAGIGIGAALTGINVRPIVEMMTWNFAILAFDQIINHAAKARYMSAGQFKVPIVFRGPNGPAHMLSAQHSQALESMMTHIPGLIVMTPSTPYDAKGMLKSAIRDDNPVIFMESELMYGIKGEVPESEYLIPIGKGDIKRQGTDVTIIAWTKMVAVALKAAELLENDGIHAEVIDPRTLRPLDEDLILESVKKTNRVVIVEDAWPFASVGTEIAHRIHTKAFDYLDAPVEKINSADIPMPYAENLEHEAMPSPEKVVTAVKKVLYRNN
ncbi:MAG: pyruvate dehydrogenase complex E1 component subunit beta [Bacteroidetes bacterium]|nr:pyruvate dehydrogenase complex E1 component subunit beta [Bacteroidota bacterium]